MWGEVHKALGIRRWLATVCFAREAYSSTDNIAMFAVDDTRPYDERPMNTMKPTDPSIRHDREGVAFTQ